MDVRHLSTCKRGHLRTPDNVKKSGNCKECDRERTRGEWKDNPEKMRKYGRRSVRKLKQDVLQMLGGECECCGEDLFPFLTLDHIHDNGVDHRRDFKGGQTEVYRKIRAGELSREDYRVLCFNCNCGRAANAGVCPHEEER